MKKISLLLAFIALLGISSFASTSDKGKYKPINQIVNSLNNLEDKSSLDESSCTVSVTYINKQGKTISLSLKVTCICTIKEACDISYAAISLVLPK